MSNFPLRKKSPTGNDMKRTTQGSTLRQQGFHEVNKRRAFLQDNSWIKKRPEEERDENYGRVVLSRHNSHDALDRKINERDEPKATISRYRSDDTLDRTLSTFRSPEAIKTQSGSLAISNATTITSTSAKAPSKKKRQSWFPPPPPGHNTTPSPGGSRRDLALHPPIPPKPTSPAASPHQLRQDNRQIHVSKPTVYAEASRSIERHLRSQDLDGIIRVATSLQNTDKGEEMDNIIQMNKSLNRNQGLDGLFRANPNAAQAEKRAQSLESLIYMNTQMDRGDKGNQSLGSLKKINQSSDTKKGKQDLHGLMKVNPEANKNMKRGESLDNLTKVTPEINRNHRGSKDLNNLIKVSSTTGKGVARNQGLENLINVTPSVNKRNQDLDKFIKINPEVLANNQRNQDLDNVIKVNSAVVKSSRSQDLDNLIKVKPPLSNTNRLDGQVNGLTDSLRKESTGTSVHFEASNNFSSNAGTRRAGPKDTVVYTRTYVENSRSPKDGYQENISGKYIQTVYSTSDRSVIEQDMCTYCRKPLGIETKMILDELQICCHSTCFKCEICKRPLENLQAGDSIWIYRQTIHCEPCYSKVIAKWIQ